MGQQAQHTPGPWTVDGVSEYTGAMRIFAANGDIVARAASYGPQSDMPLAQAGNARLISAAPDLLAALTKTFIGLQAECGAAFRDMHPATWREIEAAIAKAQA